MDGNSVAVVGRLTGDAERRESQSGRVLATFSVAWNQRRKAEGGAWDDVPHFFQCRCWMSPRQADFVVPSLRKGARVAVLGHLEQDRWKAPDGSERSAVRVTVDDPIGGIISVPRAEAETAAPSPEGRSPYQDEPYGSSGTGPYAEDIPF